MSDNWFRGIGPGGNRTLVQQMRCLEPLLGRCRGCTILDVGCAEGLISLELARAGAKLIHGVEIVQERVVKARAFFEEYDARFWCADVAEIENLDVLPKYDIVLLLAILHKLTDPEKLLSYAMDHSNKLIVVRAEPVFHDRRSEHRPIKVSETLINAGFLLTHECIGTFNEWVGFFELPSEAA